MSFIEAYRAKYPTTKPNESIDITLNSSYSTFLKDGRKINGKLDIQLRFLPRVKIQLKDKHTSLRGIDCFSNDKFGLQIDDLGPKINVVVTSITDEKSCVFQLNDNDFLQYTNEEVIEVCCLLINFRPVTFSIDLSWGEWEIKIIPAEGLKQIENELHTFGGYAVTHLVLISRERKRKFNLEEFQPVWDGLYHFLSFANGGWATPVLPVGYNEKCEVVFQQLQPRITSMWCDSTRNWFDGNKYNVLESLFPGFMSLIVDPIWGRELRAVIYWYVNSERSLPSLDTTIILAQSALELLSWQYLVIGKKVLSEKEYKKNRAAENIRRVLNEEEIDAKIPSICNDLLLRFPADDGPFALTELRNDIVHPVLKKPLNNDEMNQIWDLSMYYIERIILNLCGYYGPINHRCRPSI